jgi:hypothetical protein
VPSFTALAVLFPDCQKLTYVKQQDVALPLSEINLHAWLLSNPQGKVLKSFKSRGQICPILLRRKRTFPHGLENNHVCKWISVFHHVAA